MLGTLHSWESPHKPRQSPHSAFKDFSLPTSPRNNRSASTAFLGDIGFRGYLFPCFRRPSLRFLIGLH